MELPEEREKERARSYAKVVSVRAIESCTIRSEKEIIGSRKRQIVKKNRKKKKFALDIDALGEQGATLRSLSR